MLGHLISKLFRWGEHADFAHNVTGYILEFIGWKTGVTSAIAGIGLGFGAWWESGSIIVGVIVALIVAVLVLAVLFFIILLSDRWRAKKTAGISGGATRPPSEPFDQTVRWAMEHIAPSKDKLDAALTELRQAARLGTVTIYGRPESGHLPVGNVYKPIEPIPADHWRNFDFDILRCIFHSDPRECRTSPDDRYSATYREAYLDLRVNSAEIKAKWPKPNS